MEGDLADAVVVVAVALKLDCCCCRLDPDADVDLVEVGEGDGDDDCGNSSVGMRSRKLFAKSSAMEVAYMLVSLFWLCLQ